MGGMKYGYARTDDQTTALQIAALKRARCTHISEDKGLTGAHAKRCLRALRAVDTLIVWKLDQPGRSLRDLMTMLGDLWARGVKFTEAIDITTPTGRAMWQMIGLLAELERSLISQSAPVPEGRRRGATG
jgi:Enterobacteriaceae phage serine recombinase